MVQNIKDYDSKYQGKIQNIKDYDSKYQGLRFKISRTMIQNIKDLSRSKQTFNWLENIGAFQVLTGNRF